MPIQPPGHVGLCWGPNKDRPDDSYTGHKLYCPTCREFMTGAQAGGGSKCICVECKGETMCIEHLSEGQRLLLEP